MRLCDFWRSEWLRDAPEPQAIARGGSISVAILLTRKDDGSFSFDWLWACDREPDYVLGRALKQVVGAYTVIGHTTFEIPLASGIEARSDATPKSGAAEGESPTAESGDAR